MLDAGYLILDVNYSGERGKGGRGEGDRGCGYAYKRGCGKRLQLGGEREVKKRREGKPDVW